MAAPNSGGPEPSLILTDFHNSFTDTFSRKFATKLLIEIPTRIKCVLGSQGCLATLPCEMLETEKKLAVIWIKYIKYSCSYTPPMSHFPQCARASVYCSRAFGWCFLFPAVFWLTSQALPSSNFFSGNSVISLHGPYPLYRFKYLINTLSSSLNGMIHFCYFCHK